MVLKPNYLTGPNFYSVVGQALRRVKALLKLSIVYHVRFICIVKAHFPTTFSFGNNGTQQYEIKKVLVRFLKDWKFKRHYKCQCKHLGYSAI